MCSKLLQVKTKGECLFCYNLGHSRSSQSNSIDSKSDPGFEKLLRHLEVNTTQVCQSSRQILLNIRYNGDIVGVNASEDGVRVKVTLCYTCKSLMKTFGELYNDDGLSPELDDCVESVHRAMQTGNESLAHALKHTEGMSSEQLTIAPCDLFHACFSGILRTEIFNQCHSKLICTNRATGGNLSSNATNTSASSAIVNLLPVPANVSSREQQLDEIEYFSKSIPCASHKPQPLSAAVSANDDMKTTSASHSHASNTTGDVGSFAENSAGEIKNAVERFNRSASSPPAPENIEGMDVSNGTCTYKSSASVSFSNFSSLVTLSSTPIHGFNSNDNTQERQEIECSSEVIICTPHAPQRPTKMNLPSAVSITDAVASTSVPFAHDSTGSSLPNTYSSVSSVQNSATAQVAPSTSRQNSTVTPMSGLISPDSYTNCGVNQSTPGSSNTAGEIASCDLTFDDTGNVVEVWNDSEPMLQSPENDAWSIPPCSNDTPAKSIGSSVNLSSSSTSCTSVSVSFPNSPAICMDGVMESTSVPLSQDCNGYLGVTPNTTEKEIAPGDIANVNERSHHPASPPPSSKSEFLDIPLSAPIINSLSTDVSFSSTIGAVSAVSPVTPVENIPGENIVLTYSLPDNLSVGGDPSPLNLEQVDIPLPSNGMSGEASSVDMSSTYGRSDTNQENGNKMTEKVTPSTSRLLRSSSHYLSLVSADNQGLSSATASRHSNISNNDPAVSRRTRAQSSAAREGSATRNILSDFVNAADLSDNSMQLAPSHVEVLNIGSRSSESRTHDAGKPYADYRTQCPECSENTHAYDLDAHLLTNHPEYFVRNYFPLDLKSLCTNEHCRHVLGSVLPRERKPACPLCQQVFASRATLMRHIFKAHLTTFANQVLSYVRAITARSQDTGASERGGRAKRVHVECDSCGDTFSSRNRLSQHKNRSKRPAETCTLCDEAISRCTTLQSHMRSVHTLHLVH